MICGVMYERSRSKPSFWKRRFFLETTPRRLFIVKTEPSHGSAAPVRRSRSVCGSEASSAGTEAEACRWSAISALTASSSADSRSAAACSARASCSSRAAASRCACASAPRVMASAAAATSFSACRSARERPYGSSSILQAAACSREAAPKSKDTWRLTSWQVDAQRDRVHRHGPSHPTPACLSGALARNTAQEELCNRGKVCFALRPRDRSCSFTTAVAPGAPR